MHTGRVHLAAGCAALVGSHRAWSQQADARPYRVLLVGAGLTGCLTAARLRRDWPHSRPLELVVWERASYPAGRFGASFAHPSGSLADLGAQVLSVVEPDGEHAHCGSGEGHNIPQRAIQAAREEVGRLGLELARGLAPSEQRMLWEGIWRHYTAPGTLGGLLRRYLDQAAPTAVRFGTKLTCLERRADGWLAGGSSRADGPVSCGADAVVVCVPAPDALAVRGLGELLPAWGRHVLARVEYDSRAAVAVCYLPECAPEISRAFGGATELEVAAAAPQRIQLLSRQAAKRPEPGGCLLVGHTPRLYSDRDQACPAWWEPGLLEEAVHSAVSTITGRTAEYWRERSMPPGKAVVWRVSQLMRPMESVVDPVPPVQCICAEGGLVLAGDYMTQSSFLGCMASAMAAADAVIEEAS